MSWKERSYTKKGGIVGLILSIILILLDFIFFCDFGRKAEFCGLSILTLIPFILFGILIGWIYGKIKNKNLN